MEATLDLEISQTLKEQTQNEVSAEYVTLAESWWDSVYKSMDIAIGYLWCMFVKHNNPLDHDTDSLL